MIAERTLLRSFVILSGAKNLWSHLILSGIPSTCSQRSFAFARD